jgi:hypothetical protein
VEGAKLTDLARKMILANRTYGQLERDFPCPPGVLSKSGKSCRDFGCGPRSLGQPVARLVTLSELGVGQDHSRV